MSTKRWALIAILLLAAILRFWNLGATDFKYDEARVCNLAAQYIDSGLPPVRGMGSSAGIDNPPLFIYLIAPAVALGRDPLIVTAFISLLNVAAVGACYWIGQEYWGNKAGLLAASLLAVSPWAVYYSRKVWAQDALLPFVILFFAFLLRWTVKRRPWALSGALVSLAALTQIHMATVSIIPLFALIFVMQSVHLYRQQEIATIYRPLLLGGGASFIMYLPYLLLDALREWHNVHALYEMIRAPAQMRWEALRFALLNVGGREIHALAGAERFTEFLDTIINLEYWPDRIQEGLVVASVIYLIARLFKSQQRSHRIRDGVLLTWLFVPWLFYLRSSSPVYPHYLIPLYPAPHLVLAIAAVDLLSLANRLPKIKKWGYSLAGILFAGLIVWQSYLSLSIHAYVGRHVTPGGIGPPIRTLRSVGHTIERLAQEMRSSQVIAYCPGDNPAMHECPAVLQFLAGRSLDLLFVDYDASLLFPERDTDVPIVLAPGGSIAAQELPNHARRMSSETIWLREAHDAYRFFVLPTSYTPRPPTEPSTAPVRLENGVVLLGYGLSAPPAPGQSTRLALYWRVAQVPPHLPSQGYSFANHLLAVDEHRYGQRDGPGYPATRWQSGDTLVSWFDIPLAADAPPGPYILRIGMYVYTPPVKFESIAILDQAGHATGNVAAYWPLE